MAPGGGGKGVKGFAGQSDAEATQESRGRDGDWPGKHINPKPSTELPDHAVADGPSSDQSLLQASTTESIPQLVDAATAFELSSATFDDFGGVIPDQFNISLVDVGFPVHTFMADFNSYGFDVFQNFTDYDELWQWQHQQHEFAAPMLPSDLRAEPCKGCEEAIHNVFQYSVRHFVL